MKVILLKDVKSLGKAGQVVDVADGHGRNYLIPRGLAKEATQGSLNDLKHKKEVEKKKANQELQAAEDLKVKFEKKPLEIKVKAGEAGRLFGSVTSADIADALKKNGYKVDKRKIELKENIKELGVHQVSIKLHRDVTATLKVRVIEA